MGSIFYQQNKNLDSLSDVSGFSAALNGKTYGLKKQGGRFVPEDVSSGEGTLSGIIPNGGLYTDVVNRVGVLTNNVSGLLINGDGVSVNLNTDGGLEKDINGLAIKETNSIDPVGPNVKINNGLDITTNGVGLKTYDSSLLINNNGVGVNLGNSLSLSVGGSDQVNVKPNRNILVETAGVSLNRGKGFVNSDGALDIGAGDAISVNANNISVKYDNNSITAPNGILQANFPVMPSLPTYGTDNVVQGSLTNGSSYVLLYNDIVIPPKSIVQGHIFFNVTHKSNSGGNMPDNIQIMLNFNTSTLNDVVFTTGTYSLFNYSGDTYNYPIQWQNILQYNFFARNNTQNAINTKIIGNNNYSGNEFTQVIGTGKMFYSTLQVSL